MSKSKKTPARARPSAGNVGAPAPAAPRGAHIEGADKRETAVLVIRATERAIKSEGAMPGSFTFRGERFQVDGRLDHELRNAVARVRGGACNDVESLVLALQSSGHDVPSSAARGRS